MCQISIDDMIDKLKKNQDFTWDIEKRSLDFKEHVEWVRFKNKSNACEDIVVEVDCDSIDSLVKSLKEYADRFDKWEHISIILGLGEEFQIRPVYDAWRKDTNIDFSDFLTSTTGEKISNTGSYLDIDRLVEDSECIKSMLNNLAADVEKILLL